jgi:hypothetical protein
VQQLLLMLTLLFGDFPAVCLCQGMRQQWVAACWALSILVIAEAIFTHVSSAAAAAAAAVDWVTEKAR